MEKVCVLTLLGICTWTDMRSRKLSVSVLVFFGAAGFLLNLLTGRIPLEQEAAGVCIGIAILLIGKAVGGGIGYGDGLLLMVTGCYLGVTLNFLLVTGALLLSALWAAGLVIVKKVSSKKEIPFAPFLLTAYLGLILL